MMFKILRFRYSSRNFVRLDRQSAKLTNSRQSFCKTKYSKPNIPPVFYVTSCYKDFQTVHRPPNVKRTFIYSNNSSNFSNKILNISLTNNTVYSQKRHFSLQSSLESFAQTQTGVFKFLSESTPVEYCQKYLLLVHDFTGLPWWASIICSTILLRTCITLPLAVYQQYILAKLENLNLEFPEIVKQLKGETAMAIKMYGWDEKTARAVYNRSVRKQWNNLIIRDNCHPLKSTILLWFQIPMWISLSISFRNLVYMLPCQDLPAQLTFAELSVGGIGFIPNLTVPDMSWILPVSLGIINLLIVEMQVLSKTKHAQNSKLQKFLTNAFRGLSIFMIPIAASVPSCLVVYWTTSSAFGLIQNLVLMSPKVKRFCKIPQTTSEVQNPYQNLLSNLQTKLKIS